MLCVRSDAPAVLFRVVGFALSISLEEVLRDQVAKNVGISAKNARLGVSGWLILTR